MYVDDLKGFEDWLRCQGACVLTPTNPFEFVRFRARSSVHIVHQDKNGWLSSIPPFAQKCIERFKAGQGMKMGVTKQPRTAVGYLKASLFERDGDRCFFCNWEMSVDEATVEHLVPVAHGGPSNMNNYVLAHRDCNNKAGNLPVQEKIKMYADARRKI